MSPAGRAVLTNHDTVRFASIVADGQLVAIGRGVIDDGWLGISAVHTTATRRRQGLASAITGALLRWGASAGARHSYLQVSADNGAAVELYRTLGYWQHHEYHYRREAAVNELSRREAAVN
jgi:GNAT superfamily N-acetyltransferase